MSSSDIVRSQTDWKNSVGNINCHQFIKQVGACAFKEVLQAGHQMALQLIQHISGVLLIMR